MSKKRKADNEPVDSGRRRKAPSIGSEAAPKAAGGTKQSIYTTTDSRTEAAPIAINSAPTKAIRLFVFGGDSGEIGLGPSVRNATKPRRNDLLDPNDHLKPRIVQFSCGGMHTVALTADNKLVTWGVNDKGALGRDTTWKGVMRDADADSSEEEDDPLNSLESTPTAISNAHFAAGTHFVQVAAGDSCSFALTDTGDVYGWGTFLVC